ncbi:LOW QUALITY PROTEIN: GRB10-interacting GYF protein 1 [Accipiter gentilis]|uniref:LOW QUALITY PROTEIN: GRB10-interacting GYF protein 1 n=1 Tax=Astur gentilis TaxID=8957 RepID=UPI0021107D0C|nr:LOW QUALITY PROTEIN: GRB10-interacting GYF protein 1 [Accipiter gentilis]
MAAETLNFGPEWLRALSGGGGGVGVVTSPPPSPALPRYQLAENRYGREEMLALYVPGDKAPQEIQEREFAAIAQEEPLPPLALLPLTQEEQRNFSLSVNSVAVLRLMGRAGGGPATGGPRGRAGTRSRGRGRAEGGLVAPEVPRSQSWEERGERRFEKPPRRDGGRAPFEEGGGPLRKEPPRSDCTNWRSLREEPGAEEGGGGAGGGSWRLGPPPPPLLPPPPTRPPPRRGALAGGQPRAPPLAAAGGGGGGARGGPEERRELPEWCLEEEEGGGDGNLRRLGGLPAEQAPPEDPPKEPPLPPEPPPATTEDAPTPPAEDPSVRVPPPASDAEDEEGMKHLQQEAEKLVASLQEPSLEEEAFGGGRPPPPAADPLPLTHQAAHKWFYKDPQGEIQGPFSPQEMGEWFQAGYFPMTLLVKRGCDEVFQPLGDVIKMWGRVPFVPGPSPPPLLGNLDQERLKKQQELAAAAALYQQLQQQQFLQLLGRQPPSPCPVPPKSGELTPQQLGALLQELQALKPRQGEPNLLRSLSLPEATPLWDPSQPPGSDLGPWELPLSSRPLSPILEQLQLQLKLQELRARWEEDDQRKRRQEEELLRHKQCRQQEVLLKLLQQTGGPGGAPQNWALPKAPPTPDGERPPHKAQRGARAVGTPWGPELWSPPEKSTPAWEESGARGGLLCSGGGGSKGGRSGPPPGPCGRGVDEASLLKLLRGLPPPSETLAHWCQAALQALGAAPVPGADALPPFEAWPRPADPPEAQPFPRPLLERRGRPPAPPRGPQEVWLGAGPLPLHPFGPGAKPLPPEGAEGGRGKQHPLLLLHSDPSILGYSLHGPGGEVEMVEEY